MTATANLLVEIGTEELPPKALPALIDAFAAGMAEELERRRLKFGGIERFGTPRRLALIVTELPLQQPPLTVERKGPPVNIAFSESGDALPAAEAFAAKCGVAVEALERVATAKGEWLSHRAEEPGKKTAELLADCVTNALAALPTPKPMRWGAGNFDFVRPVHWAVLLLGEDVVDAQLFGVASGRHTRGHRFMAPDDLAIRSPEEYAVRLEEEGRVIASFAVRRARIEADVHAAAAAIGGRVVADDALFDEVTALVEWPVPITGHFDDAFLKLPREVISAVLTAHQRYFPVEGDNAGLLPAFITVANLESSDPSQVQKGNERVIRPRLADADFFWTTDTREALSARLDELSAVVYQKGLGTLADKTERTAALAHDVAEALGFDLASTERAAKLAKCDLLTSMVGEFPELQGLMGGYYAQHDGESADVAAAISEHYQPRFAGDVVPASDIGAAVAVADKLDTLCGNFAIGKKPTGNRDPFGLRRAALGVVRIVLERNLELDLKALIRTAVSLQPTDAEHAVSDEVYDYVVERLRAYYLDQAGSSSEAFDAVRARSPASLVDFHLRLGAIGSFATHPAASRLAAADKRISNILRKTTQADPAPPKASLLTESAEKALYQALEDVRGDISPLLEQRSYTQALSRLAELQQPVDAFFDDVMVMAEDEAVRTNRLGLLAALRAQFLEVADISHLTVK